MKKYLNGKQSAEVGFAVGTILTMTERLVKGDMDFTVEQLDMITRASKILSHFTEKEQLELIERGLKMGAN